MDLAHKLLCRIFLVILTFFAASIPEYAQASWELSHDCSIKRLTLNRWVEFADSIFVGEATERTPYVPETTMRDNSCWVKFRVREWLKGGGVKEIWVRSAFHNPLNEDIGLELCEFEPHNQYLIFGFYHRTQSLPLPEEWVSTASNKGSETRFYCEPNMHLNDGIDNQTVNEVRNILRKH